MHQPCKGFRYEMSVRYSRVPVIFADNMTSRGSTLRRRALRALLIAAAILALIIAVVSFSLTRYIEQHSEEWTGRKIKLSAVWFNPFNCSLSLRNVVVSESKSDSVFMSFDELYVNASPWSYVFDKEFRFSEIAFVEPYASLQMNRDDSFNYSDLIERFGSAENDAESGDGKPVRYVIEKIIIEEGAFSFLQRTFGAGVALERISFEAGTIAWDQPEIAYELQVKVVTGGRISSHGVYRPDSLSYRMMLKTDSLALDFLLPFADKVLYVKDVTGSLNTDLRIRGNSNTPVTSINGLLSLMDFYVADTVGKPVASMKRMALDFGEVAPVNGTYKIHLARVDQPHLKFDLTPTGNNLVRLSGVTADSAAQALDTTQSMNPSVDPYLNFFKLINQYFVEWGRAYAINSYVIDTLVVSQASFDFSDYTLKQPFHFLVEDMKLGAYEITDASDSILVSLASKLNHSGRLKATMHFNTGNLGDMDLRYRIDSLKVTDFSPYAEYYVAHPFWDGVVAFESSTQVSNHYMNSRNRLFVEHLEVGDKVESLTAVKLPLKLAVSLLKDVHGNVDLSIPLKGDVNDPKFRVMPVVWQVLRNLIVKAAASPYKLIARAVDADEDDVRDIKYDYMQTELRKRQNKTVALLARILNQKKSLTVKLIHISNHEWEIAQFALYRSRLEYVKTRQGKDVLNADDSLSADQISAADTAYLKFVERATGKLVANSDVESLAIEMAGGRSAIQQQIAGAEQARKRVLTEALVRRGIPANRFSIVDATNEEAALHRERPKFSISFDSGPSDAALSDSNVPSAPKGTEN